MHISNDQRQLDARRLAADVHRRLLEQGRTVATAESLTAGLISATLTEAAGTSATFRGGLVVYATDLKHQLAGVDQYLLDEHGPVHPDVAAQLAAGARARLGADYGIAVTGVAGPGGQGGRPVGEVFVAVASQFDSPAGSTVKKYEFGGTRADIRAATVAAALSDLLDVLGPPGIPGENAGARTAADTGIVPSEQPS